MFSIVDKQKRLSPSARIVLKTKLIKSLFFTAGLHSLCFIIKAVLIN